jgi:arylsulfatase A-like enzyme
MRLDNWGCMGDHRIVQTPNLDALAEKGTLFSNAFVTSAACSPSQTTIMSGQYERRHGETFGSNSAMTEGAFSQTYPMLLKKGGYFCGYVGKNHSPIGMSGKGFGYKSGRMEEMYDYWYGNHGHMTFYPKNMGSRTIYNNARADTQIEIIQEGADNFFAENSEFSGAKSFLHRRPKNRPFCLQINFNVPHGAGTSSMEQRRTDRQLYRTTYRDQIDQMPEPKHYVAYKDIKTPKIPHHAYNG